MKLKPVLTISVFLLTGLGKASGLQAPCASTSPTVTVDTALPHATVVFFAQGGILKGATRQIFTLGAVRGDSASIGQVFDGTERLALLVPKRFAVFALRPGAHTFSASQSKEHPDKKERLELMLEADKTYFLRLSTRSGSLKPFDDEIKSRLEQVTCSAFAAEMAQHEMHEITAKQLAARASSSFIPGQQLPSCTP